MWRNTRRKRIATLTDMLTYRRTFNSNGERMFVAKYLDTVPGMRHDMAGNRLLIVGSDKPDVMFSCHTDTVHKAGADFQAITLRNGIYSVADDSNCLGADDAAGVYIMLRMAHAGVPGMYVFHAGEERGGIGSAWIADNPPDWIFDIKAAIAFDRRGTKSIITHQGIGKTASDAFADSLASVIALGHQKDDGGTFTDTANYADYIAECTNISVGYEDEHRKSETLNCDYVLDLADAMCSRWDSSKLEIVRKPGDFGVQVRKAWYLQSDWDYDKDHPVDSIKDFDWADDEEDAMYDLVQRDPAAAVQLMQDYGITLDELEAYVHPGTYRKSGRRW